MYFVYIIYCPITQLSYVGQTNHLVLRYYEHRDGKSRWTRRMKAPLVVHWECFPTRAEAMKRERYYKQGAGARVKMDLISAVLNDIERVAGSEQTSVGWSPAGQQAGSIFAPVAPPENGRRHCPVLPAFTCVRPR